MLNDEGRTLVSDGAVNFVKKYGSGADLVPPENMVTTLAKQTWKKWKDRLEGAVKTEEADCENRMQDTVGAVAWHPSSGFASGVSRSSPDFFFSCNHSFKV